MRMIRVGLLMALAGCAAQQAAAPLVSSLPREGVAMPPASGVAEVRARAFLSEGGAAREVGASCRLESPYSSARFPAPSVISVPDLGAASPVLRISCSDGAHSGSADAVPALRATNGLGGWPAVGISVGTGGYSGVSVGGFWAGGVGSGPATQRVVYPDVAVMMR